MEALFSQIFSIFSIEYMFIVIMASYLIIKLIDAINKERVVPTWLKKIITLLVGIVVFVFFRKYTDVSVQCLSASYLGAIVVYDTAIKYLIKKLNIDYRK